MSSSTSISRKQAWLESLRPKTLPLGVIAIITGSALTYLTGNFKWPVALLAIITAGLLQILSNLANDYGDAVKGSDTAERIGPLRGMQKGVITQADMKKALKINIIAACISGLLLVVVACEKPEDAIGFLVLGLIAIVAAITYTVGKKPYGYLGLGDISVLIFFGWLSVMGTYYLQANTLNMITFLPATACGLLSVAVLNINNMRDIENDVKAGKNTLAVRLGPSGARIYHAIIIIVAILCLAFFNLLYLRGWTGWLFLLAVPMLMNHVRRVLSDPTPEGMRPMLENMVKAALFTNVLFSIGVILSK
ncbi:TPA: 1,4-dihydroxy-2-naphthoate polyprenyltransferase [Providencia stuartii]|uniref:1,4-dihydroxy-2-naphthoate octaprenyltransferase n=3 Tax=Providencia stuartii TaxID=588 RepID=A0AAJ1N7P0_PROST|nr:MULTISPECIES: 1,4-dihydroxy-2-naphthoate polyprenyltransferase [Providencia]SST05101.1 1,4-dihydroxy-2-naphthoate octaprenyltransferase [Acinetobacter baumannii]AFH94071.1 1,4-dihydroxy-2-naphthoate octaprenyltransferase [Providencia stuartii MRSN 2154]AIN63029.1 1,4-dihydroxy-2-naphthoate octaprenyltransferase [Providencia stuartii]AMG67581.1 1,4-dihydroxy-2-naphthoate polyprenyltransferase [Providencia stuartii]APG52011.1 1,4-dihydroxy-2-naphthoate polyprenyltransferase [Providencia stuar